MKIIVIAGSVIGIVALVGLFILLNPGGPDDGPQEQDITLVISDEGMIPNRAEVNEGDTVTLRFDASEEGTIHIHGYDFEVAVSPDEVAEVSFTASTTGRFEMELHGANSSHEHNGDENTCEAVLPAGAPDPGIQVTASAGDEPGEIDVSVALENFVLEGEPVQEGLTSGHWHLYVNDVQVGMYALTDVTTEVDNAGEYEIMATLSDTEHCDLEAQAMTSVTIEEGSSHDDHNEATPEPDGSDEEGEVRSLGFLDVLPR